jgi:hypothetical protein
MASSQHEVDTNRELESLDGAATWLVASFTTLTAGLTAFGAVSGGLTRMLRNYPGLSVWGAILASVAIGIGLGMTLSRPIRITGGTVDSITARRWLLRIGVLFFVIGLTLAVTAATQAPHGRERPQITASLNYENGLTLVGEVKASDLRWTDFMEVSVLAAWISEDSPNSIRWESRKFLYISHTGPDADGNVNLALRVPIRTEKRWNIIQVAGSIERERAPFPNCTPEAPENFGCIALRLPVAHLPQVSATWSTIGDHPALTVTTKAHDEPSTNLIRTTVLARSRGKMHILSQARLSSDSKGDVSHTQVMLVSGRDTTVCVIAERLLDPLPKLKFPPASNRCPAGNQGRLVERLAVPK